MVNNKDIYMYAVILQRASAIELRILQSRVEMAEKARECAQAECK